MINKVEQAAADSPKAPRKKPGSGTLAGAFGAVLQAVLRPKPGGPGKHPELTQMLREIDRETRELKVQIADLESLGKKVRTLQAAPAKKVK